MLYYTISHFGFLTSYCNTVYGGSVIIPCKDPSPIDVLSQFFFQVQRYTWLIAIYCVYLLTEI